MDKKPNKKTFEEGLSREEKKFPEPNREATNLKGLNKKLSLYSSIRRRGPRRLLLAAVFHGPGRYVPQAQGGGLVGFRRAGRKLCSACVRA